LATSVLDNVGTATEMAFTLAQSKIQKPGPKAAVEKGAALLRGLRRAAGLTLEEMGREREFTNIYHSHDAARALSDADFAAALSFADTAFAAALNFLTRHKSPAPVPPCRRSPRKARRREG